MTETSLHWNGIYSSRPVTDVSWYQRDPTVSLRLITADASVDSSILDVGSGASLLADRLLDLGYTDVTLLDVSEVALQEVRHRLGAPPALQYVVSDVRTWLPSRQYDLWHDRAVFHFLTDVEDQQRYVATARDALKPGGALILGVFAEDGPTSCSGLAVRRYDFQELAAVFASDFTLESHEKEHHVTPSGGVQSFTWVVLRRAEG